MYNLYLNQYLDQIHDEIRLSYQASCQLVIKAAQLYFTGASDSSDPILECAKTCLCLIVDRPLQIQIELDLIQALHLLDELKVNQLPARLHIATDKLIFIEKALDSSPDAFKDPKKLLKLAYLMHVGDDGVTDDQRRAKVITMCAEKAFEFNDFQRTERYCCELVSLSYAPSWNLCERAALCSSLPNAEKRLEMLIFALAYCDPSSIRRIQAEVSLLKVNLIVSSFANDLNTCVSITDQNRLSDSISELVEQVLESMASKVELNEQVEFLQNSSSLQHPRLFQLKALNNQKKCLSSDAFINGLNLMRMFCLTSEQAEKFVGRWDSIVNGLCRVTVKFDIPFTVALLLSLTNPLNADQLFNTFKQNPTLFELALFYYAIRFKLESTSHDQMDDVWTTDPRRLIADVHNHVMSKNNDEKSAVLSRFQYYVKEVAKFWQVTALESVSKDISASRFISDSAYRRETILGLALTNDIEMFDSAVQFAIDYNVDLWDVYMTHVEYLLTESRLSPGKIQSQVKEKDLLTKVGTKPDQFVSRMYERIYPLLDGTLHSALLLFYWVLEQTCVADTDPGQNAKLNLKILRILSKMAPTLDYKALTQVSECSKTEEIVRIFGAILNDKNVEQMAQVMKHIPNKIISPSDIYALWAEIKFFEVTRNESTTSAMIAIGPKLQKLNLESFTHFFDQVGFSDRAIIELTTHQRKTVLNVCLNELADHIKEWECDDKLNEKMKFIQWFAELDDFVLPHLKITTKNIDTMLYSTKGDSDLLYSFFGKLLLTEEISNFHRLIDELVNYKKEFSIEMVVRVAVTNTLHQLNNYVLNQKAADVGNCLQKLDQYVLKANELKLVNNLVYSIVKEQNRRQNYSPQSKLVLINWLSDSKSKYVKTDLPSQVAGEKVADVNEVDTEVQQFKSIVMTAFAGVELSANSFGDEKSKLNLIKRLLENAVFLSQMDVIYALLLNWRHFDTFKKDKPFANPWYHFTKGFFELKNIENVCDKVVDKLLLVVEECLLSEDCLIALYEMIKEHSFWPHAVKFGLISKNLKVTNIIVGDLFNLEQIKPWNKEVIELIIKNGNLIIDLIGGSFYQSITHRMLEEHNESDIELIVGSLENVGAFVDAGSLLLLRQGLHPSLCTQSAALAALKRNNR